MARKKKPRGVLIGGLFLPLLYDELDSMAFVSLGGNAAKLYPYVKRAARIVATKLGASSEKDVIFDFTYSQAAKMGFAEKTFRRGMQELWAKGFIDVVRIGGRLKSKQGGRTNSQYRLSGKWKTYGIYPAGNWVDRTQFEPDPWGCRSEPLSIEEVSNW